MAHRLARSSFALAAALALAACKDKPTEKPAPSEVFAGTEGMALAPAAATAKAPAAATYPNHVVAYGATRGLTLDGRVILPPSKDPVHGFDVKDKPGNIHDLIVLPLDAALRSATPGETTLVAIAADTPYRIAGEIVFTLGNFGVRKLELLVQAGTEKRIVSVPLATTALPCGETLADIEHDRAVLDSLFGGDGGAPQALAFVPLSARDPICLAADFSADGVRVRSRRDRLSASCVEVAPIAEGMVATLATPSDGSLPASEVARCTGALKTKFPHAVGARVVVSASGEKPWRDVVAMLDAFGPPSGFGDPFLGAPR